MDKWRKFIPQFKAKVVLELLSGAKTPAQACREYGLRDSLVYKWRGEFLERAYTVFADKGNHQDGVRGSNRQAGANGYVERVIRTIKEEEVELSEYAGCWDAKARIGEFIEEVYREKRIHSVLGYLTSAEFEEKWHREQKPVSSLSNNDQKTVQLWGPTRSHFKTLPRQIMMQAMVKKPSYTTIDLS